jgi:hypothetical protein
MYLKIKRGEGMKNFLQKVKEACEALGEAPYDDEKTRKIESERTRKTIEHYEKQKNEKIADIIKRDFPRD